MDFHKVTIWICQSIEKVLDQPPFLKIMVWTLDLEILKLFLWLMKFLSLFLLESEDFLSILICPRHGVEFRDKLEI